LIKHLALELLNVVLVNDEAAFGRGWALLAALLWLEILLLVLQFFLRRKLDLLVFDICLL